MGRGSVVGIAVGYELGGPGIKFRSQWPLGLARNSQSYRLLESWVRIPPGAWMFMLFNSTDKGTS